VSEARSKPNVITAGDSKKEKIAKGKIDELAQAR
jgi:hypothetical protein